MPSDRDDFPTLRPITTRPVALNLAAWEMDMPVVLGATPGLLLIGTRFVHRYSEGWGSDEPSAVLPRNRWRVEVEIRGYNGVCGYWITEFWKWDRSGETHHEQPRTLSYEESRELEKVYAERQKEANAATHPAHWIPYRGYWIEYDPPPIPSRNHDWQWWHDDYDGAPDAHDHRRGSAPSLEEAKRQIDEQIEESESAEELSCYLCHITNDDFPDDYFRAAGLPQSDLHVCSRCDGSYQHQTDRREAWSAEGSGV